MASKFNSGREIAQADSGWDDEGYRVVYQLMQDSYANGDVKLTLLRKTGYDHGYRKVMSGHSIAERYRIKGEGRFARVEKIRDRFVENMTADGYKATITSKDRYS